MRKIIAPIYMTLKFKTKKDKTIGLNLNWYRNTHYMITNKIKHMFHEEIEKQIKGVTFNGQIGICYTLFYRRKCDLMNFGSIVDKFFQDALVEFKCIPDDNVDKVIECHFKVGGKDKENPRFEITII